MTIQRPHRRFTSGPGACLPPLPGCSNKPVFSGGRGRAEMHPPADPLCRSRLNRNGFTLIEIIVSLILVGIIASFSTVFMVSGVQNFFLTREAVESAFRAEVALNRMALELRSISENGLPGNPVLNTSITYTSDDPNLPGTRKLEFDDGNLYLTINTIEYLLMEDVSSPQLSASYADMDNDGSNEVAYIDIGFAVGAMPAFSVRVYPRNMVAQP
ncbi:hypothetical protein D3OALGA1CA_3689 [Olavius algarvensis associated proteobacterium Delta 3]|nr:hypothetical protein D3OALGA1CA_3689 [Olavius algarvensis associated proteobacterium Delta 3]CAB5148377.1 hypothetical protein D3OALGB2SA_4650 [Olavius algarvensis associated proteobacterium Delta 3]